MELGVMLPIVSLPPRFRAPAWEQHGTAADLARIAVAADEAGFRYLCTPEHVALPLSREDTRGGRYWDPFSTLGYLAAVTERIDLVTYVLVLAYHHPLDIVKRAGTVDVISGGRLHLGLGVGSLREEFALLGAAYEGRGARADDALRAIRASLGARVASYTGTHYSYRDFIVEPGLRTDTPLWIGGRTPRSLRRAVEFADHWSPFSLPVDEAVRMLRAPSVQEAVARRSRPLKLVHYHDGERLDPLRDPAAGLRLLDELRTAGVAGLVTQFAATSSAHYAEQIGAFAALAARG